MTLAGYTNQKSFCNVVPGICNTHPPSWNSRRRDTHEPDLHHALYFFVFFLRGPVRGSADQGFVEGQERVDSPCMLVAVN